MRCIICDYHENLTSDFQDLNPKVDIPRKLVKRDDNEYYCSVCYEMIEDTANEMEEDNLQLDLDNVSITWYDIPVDNEEEDYEE